MKLIKIGKASKMLGITPQTLIKWEKTGELLPVRKSAGGTRYYNENNLLDLCEVEDTKEDTKNNLTIAYARVSSHDQKSDLIRQSDILKIYCESKSWNFEIIEDLGSGMNYQKEGLNKLIKLILEKSINRIVLTHKDRLLRFGADLIFSICRLQNIEVVIINENEKGSFEEELAKDVLEIITVFSAKLHGSRSHKNKKLIKELNKITESAL